MGKLRSDSPISRRIVLSFLDFLNSVELAPGVDSEGIDVATQCLKEAFRLNSCTNTNGIPPGDLVRLFTALENGERCEEQSGPGVPKKMNTSSSASSSLTAEDQPQSSKSVGKGKDFEDELLGKFINSLERMNFFKTSRDEDEDPELVEKAMKLFNDALNVMEIEMPERETLNVNKLAEVFKLGGNRSMQSKSYEEAIELYTCAIALCETNAVYYCNRAAAFTHTQKYTEAIHDCLKSIAINPGYSKAYSRLGNAHFAQGNYSDALSDFLKALQLDPNNASVKENIQATKQKLLEQNQQNQGPSRQRGEWSNQSSNYTSSGAFPSFNFNVSNSEFPPSGAFPTFDFNIDSVIPPSVNVTGMSLPPEINDILRAAEQAANHVTSTFSFGEGSEQFRSGSQQNAHRDNDQS